MRYIVVKEGKASGAINTNEDGARAIHLATGDTIVDPKDVPVQLNDVYFDGEWYRDGLKVLTPLEQANKDHQEEMTNTLNNAAQVVQKLYELDQEIINNLEGENNV